jgi:uncharacterized protein
MKKIILFAFACASVQAIAQDKSLVNTSASPYAKLTNVNMGDVTWTSGFWAERMTICKDSMVPNLWKTYTNASVSHAFKNFEIAAGLDTGSHKGPPFHDGDFYKLFESVASIYAITKDKRLDELMDKVIPVIAKSQREDGYIHSPVMIEERKKTAKTKAFEDRLNFETYNMGHLMTAACVHFRATGKTSLLNVAIRAADYLNSFFKRSSPELARNAICPSHYMGVVELYRTTKNPQYLELAKNLINIRGLVENGTDDNQDRIPFRQQKVAMGHAVRANYLYAGVADVYAETGDTSLLNCLDPIWRDVVYRKMYITGGCGALYDGVSPYGVSYKPPEIQKTHQSYGRAYQLPNMTAHNETCANIGSLLWNWRMFQLSGEEKYADIVELVLYNSILSGISLDGNKFFYTNPLSASGDFPYDLRWHGGRQKYIRLSNCCPPNTVRTLAEVSNYAYSISDNGVWVNLYGSNKLSTKLKDGSAVELTQESNYPWDGQVQIKMQRKAEKPFSLNLRIPGWCKKFVIKVNGQPVAVKSTPGQYADIHRNWQEGDVVTLDMDMPVTLMETHPLVEETRNQVAVKRGPVVYCAESVDFPKDINIFNIVLPVKNDLQPKKASIENSNITVLEGTGFLQKQEDWNQALYKEVNQDRKPVRVKLVPYYAWGNRGGDDMTVWMLLGR